MIKTSLKGKYLGFLYTNLTLESWLEFILQINFFKNSENIVYYTEIHKNAPVMIFEDVFKSILKINTFFILIRYFLRLIFCMVRNIILLFLS